MPSRNFNRDDKFILEIGLSDEKGMFDPNGTVYAADGSTNPELQMLRPYLAKIGDEAIELVIEYKATGYDDPGSRHGGPHGLGYAPESDFEAIPSEVYLNISGNTPRKIRLKPAIANQIFQRYEDQLLDNTDFGSEDDYMESVNKIANVITEDPDIFI